MAESTSKSARTESYHVVHNVRTCGDLNDMATIVQAFDHLLLGGWSSLGRLRRFGLLEVVMCLRKGFVNIKFFCHLLTR